MFAKLNSCIKFLCFMRKIFVSFFLLAAIVIIFNSCTQTTYTNDNVVPTSMKISLSKTTIIADGIDKSEVTVKDQSGNDISLTSIIVVNDIAINGTAITLEASQQGTFKVFATKFGIISDTLTISTTAPTTAKYSTKVLAEDYTGSWCGWCPRVAYKMNNFVQNNSKIIPIRFHNNDALSSPSVDSALRAASGITAVPNVIINRLTTLKENGDVNSLADSVGFRPYLQKRAVLGLALNSTISGNTLNLTTKVGFDATISDSLKLVVVLVEDGLILPQTNYYSNNSSYPATPFFSSGNPITNFVHHSVFRQSPTTVFGITIPSTAQVKNGEYTSTFTFNITGYTANNLKVVAFVQYAGSQVKSGVLNAQLVAAGSNQAYD